MRISRTDFCISLTLLAATLALYSPVRKFGFIENYDDPQYVLNNPHLKGGLSQEGIKWAFTSADDANWFPLTRLSYIVDYQLFGLESGGYHLTNLLLHALAALALFVFLLSATGERWPSAFVAFLFALHPLHIESVAWVAERKDVLCALFWFLTLWAWLRYTKRPSRQTWLLPLILFAMGLMSKPMIVTLPFVLLLLDAWPLRRQYGRQLLIEKLPFFALSAASAVVTFLAQKKGGAVRTLATFPLGLRVENALVTSIVYIADTFWPSRLAVFYPYPKQLPLWQAAAAALILVSISALVLRCFTTRPYLAVGWFWYLGTLVPVIGLLQVGVQSRADRYMYVPMVGLAVMLAWGGAELVRSCPPLQRWVSGLAAAALIALAPVTWVQLRYWKNCETLFHHTIEVTSRNGEAYLLLGNWLSSIPSRRADTIAAFEAGVRAIPDEERLHTGLAAVLLGTGVPANRSIAIAHLRMALRINPDYAPAHSNLSSALSITGHPAEAIEEAKAALRIDPNDSGAHYMLGYALSTVPGRSEEAIEQFRAALNIRPDFPEAHNSLGLELTKVPGGAFEALYELEEALRINPDYRPAHVNLGMALAQVPGRLPEAISQLRDALKLQPEPSLQQTLEKLEARQRQAKP